MSDDAGPRCLLVREAACRAHDERAFVEAAVLRGWHVARSVLDVPAGATVVARHAAWPWPEDLERDVRRMGARLLNDAHAYRFADDAARWAAALGDLTPETWDRFEAIPDVPLIVKGHKAHKGRWDRMYAPDRAAAIELRSQIWAEIGRSDEPVVARRYVPLRRIGGGLAGACPPSAEWRVFVLDGRVVGGGAYWPPDDCDAALAPWQTLPAHLLARAVARVAAACPSLRWYTLDVAERAAGGHLVVEISDGQRAGFSEADPAALLAAMDDVLAGRVPPRVSRAAAEAVP